MLHCVLLLLCFTALPYVIFIVGEKSCQQMALYLTVLTSRWDFDELLEGDDGLTRSPALVALHLDKHFGSLAVAANFAAHHSSQPLSFEACAFAVGAHVGLWTHQQVSPLCSFLQPPVF